VLLLPNAKTEHNQNDTPKCHEQTITRSTTNDDRHPIRNNSLRLGESNFDSNNHFEP